MKAIIAKNNLGYIGLGGRLPWKSVEDLKHFKRLTLGGRLLAGYKTALTLPTLIGRELVVYDNTDRTTDYTQVEWCIGGKATYEAFCHLFTELHISNIEDDTEGDVDYPDLTNLNPDCVIYNYNFYTNY